MATITEDYVSFEVAKLLKEKGFDTFKSYGWDEQLFDKEHPRNFSICFDNKEHWISCPTLQMAMKWLREVHNIVIGINVGNENNRDNTDYSNPDRWWYFWEFTDTKGVYREELQPDALANEYPTYEEACEAACLYVLKNLI